MREKQHCCPNCDTVLTLQYEPDEAEGVCYECAICGYRAPAEGLRDVTAEDEHAHRRSHAR